ncbi:hypothetical protein HMPREF1991_01287 [Hoylesella loescheii DSM 19665 = JCM 12249 = ATCC 15930]|uniref:Uncharacterized protein n=1 Tax=Hoylesella loescheii DSM 19665 = JCM 12249 = ATCC 15930 TaxID=1122985 RepID=A0A069QIW5_HOYLO|nr:hypothetical protein HMPREF1991_01287 [Hoylesella loescheii DSM 19665 = JCM 12249 = ATCC 15930]
MFVPTCDYLSTCKPHGHIAHKVDKHNCKNAKQCQKAYKLGVC